jgi:hypothetical protein
MKLGMNSQDLFDFVLTRFDEQYEQTVKVQVRQIQNWG